MGKQIPAKPKIKCGANPDQKARTQLFHRRNEQQHQRDAKRQKQERIDTAAGKDTVKHLHRIDRDDHVQHIDDHAESADKGNRPPEHPFQRGAIPFPCRARLADRLDFVQQGHCVPSRNPVRSKSCITSNMAHAPSDPRQTCYEPPIRLHKHYSRATYKDVLTN